jgi:SAM-dependent methyltransferase
MAGESEAERLRFILDGQRHADCYLTPLADPADKTVLVLGSGAGTDVLWALRHGAREVVGLDAAEQEPGAFRAGAAQYGLDAGRVSFHQMDLRDAARLGRRFDLVLSNNVFEHVADLPGAFAACAAAVEPGSGRVAIFSSPLYYSSAGSHLPVEPWEHLWGEPDAVRERLLQEGLLTPGHALERMDLDEYLRGEITLNRARLPDYLDAARQSGLAFLHFQALADERLAQLPSYLEKIRRRAGPVEIADLSVAGIAVELIRLGAASEAEVRPMAQIRVDDERYRHGEEVAAVQRLVKSVETSLSFRISRGITAPARWVRDRLR